MNISARVIGSGALCKWLRHGLSRGSPKSGRSCLSLAKGSHGTRDVRI